MRDHGDKNAWKLSCDDSATEEKKMNNGVDCSCWDLRLDRLDKLSKFLTKTMIATEDIKSKHSTELEHQE